MAVEARSHVASVSGWLLLNRPEARKEFSTDHVHLGLPYRWVLCAASVSLQLHDSGQSVFDATC